MDLAKLVCLRGSLVVVGQSIDVIAEASIRQIAITSQASAPFHITIATEDELCSSPKKFDDLLLSVTLNLEPIINLGVMEQDGSYFIAILWKTGIEIRRELGLPFKHLFIALSQEKSDFPGKGVTPILASNWLVVPPNQVSFMMDYSKCLGQVSSGVLATQYLAQSLTILNHLYLSRNRDAGVLDLLAVMLYKSKDMDRCWEVCKEFMSLFPKDPRAHFRSAAYHHHVARSPQAPAYSWKLAMLFYGEAAKLALSLEMLQDQPLLGHTKNLLQKACQAILRCSSHAEFGCILRRAESKSFPEEYLYLTVPWNPGVRNAVLGAFIERGEPNTSMLLSLESRERLCIYDFESQSFLNMPRFFRWITPFRVAAMSTPKGVHDIRLLAKLGIGTVITFTKEERLNSEWFAGFHPMRNEFLPVTNYRSPTIAQIDFFFALIEEASEAKSATLVHCGGGKGRAGTFIACYLARYGFIGLADQHPKYTANDIIRTLRQMRPGSIETVEQEQFIASFVKELWKRAETGGKPMLLPEPEPEDTSGFSVLQVDGQFNPKCKLIVCCGIPGSGKSTVSNSLAKAGWTVASQDETGSLRACAAIVCNAVRQNNPVIIDRCNPTILDRKEWMDLAMASPKDVTCLFFDYNEALCLQRANLRLDHPTLEYSSRCINAIRSMSKSLQQPTMAEGFGTLITIRNLAAANKFIEYYCGTETSPPAHDSEASPSSSSQTSDPESKRANLHKFPRTRHLLNLGSATRDDLVMSKADVASFFRSSGGDEKLTITLEEKVDGANLGFSIDPRTKQIRAQNRSHFVTSKSHPQFRKLDLWIDNHRDELMTLLGCPHGKYEDGACTYVLFGEWLQATHSIQYTRLPDYFLAFDMFDMEEKRFWSRERFRAALIKTTIHMVPEISLPEVITEDVLKELMEKQSAFGDETIEGVYVRQDRGPFLLERSKVVRHDFIGGNPHWSKQVASQNIILWQDPYAV